MVRHWRVGVFLAVFWVNQMLVELGGRDKLPAASALHFDGGVDHFLESVKELVILAVPRPFILLRLLF